MSRRKAPNAARRDARPAEACPPRVTPIPEHAFHRAFATARAHTNTLGGETFLISAATVYVRVNDRHYRIDDAGSLTHADALRLATREDRH